MQTNEDIVPANQKGIIISALLNITTVSHINRTAVWYGLYIV